jgi:hypothetical protein
VKGQIITNNEREIIRENTFIIRENFEKLTFININSILNFNNLGKMLIS